LQGRQRRPLTNVTHAKDAGDCGQHRVGIGQWRQGDEDDAVRKGGGERRGGFDGDARLAHAAGAGQGDQAHIISH
jgi:hypothetical protein